MLKYENLEPCVIVKCLLIPMYHKITQMRCVWWAVAILVVANINVVQDEEDKKVWHVVWGYLQSMVGEVNFDPDSGLNVTQFLAKYEYPLESHDVVTEDGYILTCHRIPYGRNQAGSVSRPAILLVHCLACSSMDWVWQAPNKSLALLLADSGYDVWLANTRGNRNSMRHKTLTTENASFWDFSFHEKGYYDLPATIDYILSNTNQNKISYIGHSQGTSAALVLTTSRPAYNDKLNLMVLLSPVAYIEHLTSPVVRWLTQNNFVWKSILNLLGIHGIPYSSYVPVLGNIFCSEYSATQDLCYYFISLFSGFDQDQIDRAKLTVFLTNTPSGLSVKDIDHYTQEVKSGKFQPYDYGNPVTNFARYGAFEPPSYNISKITVPTAVYYAQNDFLSNVTDVDVLLSKMNTEIVDKYLIEYEKFNHLDFIMAKDVKTLIYERVINLVQERNPAT